MLGSIRSVRVTLTFLGLAGWLGTGESRRESPRATSGCDVRRTAILGSKAGAQEAKPSARRLRRTAALDVSEFFAQPGDDPPRPFVPLRPSTTDDRRRLEVVRLYSAGRALEDRRAWADAVAVLQEALKLEPDSIAVARRLCRIYIGALGRPDLAIDYGKRVLAAEPGDSETLEPAGGVLPPKRPCRGRVDLERGSGEPEARARMRSGDCWHSMSWAGCTPAGCIRRRRRRTLSPRCWRGWTTSRPIRLTPVEQFRILGNNPAMAYFNFAMVFLAAKRNELAVKALEHGLVYDEDNTQISLLLADTLLKLNRGQQALALVDRHIERQTPFVEAYELLGTRAQGAQTRERDHAAAGSSGAGAIRRMFRFSTFLPIAIGRRARTTRPRPFTSRCFRRSRPHRLTALWPVRS